MQINTVRPFLPRIDEVVDEFAKILSNGMVTNNSTYVKAFEDSLQKYFQSILSPVVFNNGEMALYSLIQAWKLKLGYSIHESFDVLVPSFTFSGTVNAIVANNLRPIFCDVDKTLTINPDKLEAGSNIKMIVGVGVYGNLPDIERLGQYAQENKLVMILDNAPAFGSKYKNKFPNQYGYDEIYSFHATKLFSSMEGGAAISNNMEVVESLKKLRDFGQFEKTRGDVDVPGLNSKMQEISAIVGLKNLEKIDFIMKSRTSNIMMYNEFFTKCVNDNLFAKMVVNDEVFCTYLYYPIILKDEASIFVNYMNENEIAVRRYYTAVHTLKLYSGKYRELNLDYTNSIKDKIVSLPIHTLMTKEEIIYLFKTIREFFKKK